MAGFLEVIVAFITYIVAIVSGVDVTGCPLPTLFGNNCMNLENFRQCISLAYADCQSIAILESCPLQFRCNDPEPSTQCPDPSSSCMNQENYAKCRDLEASGCQNILVLESCPLQFGCQNGASRELGRSRLLLEDDQPDACVSLHVYSNKQCAGKPVRELTFPTWSRPGSPCYHDAMMNKFSVKDQFCNAHTGNWHETVFMGSEDCREAFWSKTTTLIFTSDGCVDGFSLKECTFQSCEKTSGDKFVHHHIAGRMLGDEHHRIAD